MKLSLVASLNTIYFKWIPLGRRVSLTNCCNCVKQRHLVFFFRDSLFSLIPFNTCCMSFIFYLVCSSTFISLALCHCGFVCILPFRDKVLKKALQSNVGHCLEYEKKIFTSQVWYSVLHSWHVICVALSCIKSSNCFHKSRAQVTLKTEYHFAVNYVFLFLSRTCCLCLPTFNSLFFAEWPFHYFCLHHCLMCLVSCSSCHILCSHP